MPEVVGIQYLKGGGVYLFYSPKEKLALDSFCVVEAEHGLQIARVVRTSRFVAEDRLPKNMRSILRIASGRDHEQLKKNAKKETEAYNLCRDKVQEKAMQMKLVDVSYTLDGRKAIFYFTAENRVDFRELVKELAQALKIKIEMRQIGVRDEARRLGGVGCCGRVLCCASFLRDFSSVSIRMAKEQNLSLNPSKVSGLCGRLMCCLAYEYEGSAAKSKKKKGEFKPVSENKIRAGSETPATGEDTHSEPQAEQKQEEAVNQNEEVKREHPFQAQEAAAENQRKADKRHEGFRRAQGHRNKKPYRYR